MYLCTKIGVNQIVFGLYLLLGHTMSLNLIVIQVARDLIQQATLDIFYCRILSYCMLHY